MSETVGERMRRYLLDSSDEDLQRLLTIAELTAEPTRTAFAKIGIKPGWRVLDCGCGPLGALAVMAEMVGPEGQVVGIDFSEAAVQRARSARWMDRRSRAASQPAAALLATARCAHDLLGASV